MFYGEIAFRVDNYFHIWNNLIKRHMTFPLITKFKSNADVSKLSFYISKVNVGRKSIV